MSALVSVAAWWGSSLWLLSWQVAVLIAVVSAISALCRRMAPALHYGLWCLVLVRLCVPFPLTIPWGVSNHVRETAVTGLTAVLPGAAMLQAPLVQYQPPLAQGHPLAPALSLPAVAGLAWFVVTAAILALVAARLHQMRRLVAQCTRPERAELHALLAAACARMKIARPVAIRCFPGDSPRRGPVAIGVLQPTIILPPDMAETWRPEELEPVLLHELAHIARKDLLVNAVQILVQAVYFFHPLVWYANARIRRERELVCDDLAVLHSAGERKVYSRGIVRVLEDMARDKPVLEWASMGMTEQRSFLSKRIIRMMSHDYRMYRPIGAIAGAALFVLCAAAIAVAGEGTSAGSSAAANGYTHLVTFEPVGDFKPSTPKELLEAFNATVHGIRTGYFRTAPRDGVIVGSICTDAPDKLRKALEASTRLKWVSQETLTPELFAAHSARAQESLPPADGGFASPHGYTHLVKFEPVGDFKPRTPKELLGVFNGVCKARTGYFRTAPEGGKLVGRICTDDPEALRASMGQEPRLKWDSVERLTAETFAAHEATAQLSLP